MLFIIGIYFFESLLVYIFKLDRSNYKIIFLKNSIKEEYLGFGKISERQINKKKIN